MRQEKFYAKLIKCEFLVPELKFLGHIVGIDGIKPDPKKVQVVMDWPTPNTVKELQSFMGLANYFRKFILGYSTLMAPLTALTSKGVVYTWTPECQVAFEKVKDMLCNAPVLSLPDFDLP